MTEAQSVGLVIASCFCIAYYITNAKTYKILAVVYSLNALIHFGFYSVPAWSVWWPAIYSTLDLIAMLAIIAIGDIRKKLHSLCLSALILMHTLLAFDLVSELLLGFETNMVFSYYYQLIMTIIAAQIIAGFSDAAAEYRRVNSPGNRVNKRRDHAKNNHQGANP
jgi:hypothetical protein